MGHYRYVNVNAFVDAGSFKSSIKGSIKESRKEENDSLSADSFESPTKAEEITTKEGVK